MARLTPLQRIALRRTVRRYWRPVRRYWRPVRPWVAAVPWVAVPLAYMYALHVAMLPH